MWHNNILETIGNTPLVRLNCVTKSIPATVLAKIETVNPGNSIKDRMAVKMIEDAEKSGQLKPGGTIIEGTSGNTGMGLAIAGIVKGYKCIFTTTDKQSQEKVDALRALGAEVIVCPTNVDPQDERSYYSVSSRLEKETPNSWKANQYDNLSNSDAHYQSTGPEIWEQTEGKITHLLVGVGTGGTISGVAKYLKEKNTNIKIWGIDSYGSIFKKYHETGIFDKNEIYPYITEGIGEDFLPKNVDFNLIDHFEKVTDKDAALYTRQIARKEGIFVGNSAGAAIAGLLQLKDRLKKDDMVVVVFHDHGIRYMNKMFNDAWMMDRGFLNRKQTTAAELINGNKLQKTIHVGSMATIQETFNIFQEHGISQLPIINDNKQAGSISEAQLYSALIKNPNIKTKAVKDIMGNPFPVVDNKESLQNISALITKNNPAVLVKDIAGGFYIITKEDIINSIL